jgi:hypothetical protein
VNTPLNRAARVARWAVATPWSRDAAVTRTTVHAVVSAACGDDAAAFVWDWDWLWRTEQRGHVRRGRHLVQVLDRRALRDAPCERPSDAALLAAAAVIERAADDDTNVMLRPRLRAEAQLIRDICGEIGELAPSASESTTEGDTKAMTVQRRNILGPPADLGAKANDVNGGDDSLAARPPYSAPLAMTDQTSPQTAPERDNLETHYRAAQNAASQIGADQGAGGTTVAANGSAVTGSIPASPTGDLIGQESPLVQRADGANLADGGAGMAI